MAPNIADAGSKAWAKHGLQLLRQHAITTGEGGVLSTNDARAKRLRDHAMHPRSRYFHEERGFNYRITNLQARLELRSWSASRIFLSRPTEIMESDPATNQVQLNRARDGEAAADAAGTFFACWSRSNSARCCPRCRCTSRRRYRCRRGRRRSASHYELIKSDVWRFGSRVNALLKKLSPA